MRFLNFKMYIVLIVVILMTISAVSSQAAFKPSAKGKKFIASGWHMPDAAYIREHIQDMEKIPYDGLIFGYFYPFFPNMRNQQGDLAKYVENVKATKFGRFTDNFIGVESGNDGTFDWFDDASCRDMIANWRALARAAKQAGMKGMKFDPECYEGPSPFNFETLKQHENKTPEEYEKQVQKVAGQIVEAMNEEYPNITLLFYFGPSVAGYPRNLKGWCGMMPAFVDGMIKNAKPGFKIVDGFEQAYGYRTEKQYAEGRAKMVATAPHSAFPSAYRKHVQVGFSFWPDQMAGNPTIGRKSFNVDDITLNYYVPDEVAYAANNSLRYTDEYVWMWAESFDVWNRQVMVYDSTGKWEYKPIPTGYIEALARTKVGVIPVPAKRTMGRSGVNFTAKDLGETEDSKVFGDMWASYDDIADLPLNWKFLPDPSDKGTKAGYSMTNYDDSAWPTIEIREIWDQQGFANLSTYGWYRVKFNTPNVSRGKKLYLAFGAVDEGAYVYVNGKLAGVHDKEPDISYIERFTIDVTKQLKPGQVNVIAVKVKNTIGVGGIWRGVKLISAR